MEIFGLVSPHILNYMGLFNNNEVIFTLYKDGNIIEQSFTPDSFIKMESPDDIMQQIIRTVDFDITNRAAGELPIVFQDVPTERVYFLEEYGILYVVLRIYMPPSFYQIMEMLYDVDPNVFSYL